MSPITSILLRSVGWRMTLRYLAIISGIGLVGCGILIRRRIPLVSNVSQDGQGLHKSLLSNFYHHFNDRNFTIMYIAMFLTSLGYMMPFTHVVKYAEIEGVSTSRAVFIVSIVGICSAVGRAILGQLADKCNRLHTFRVCLLMGGLSTLFWVACTDFVSLVVYAVLFGYFAGGFISLQPVVCSELFRGQDMGELMGLIYTASTMGNMFSGPIGGGLYDVTGTYTASIVVAGMFMTLGAVVSMGLLPPPVKIEEKGASDESCGAETAMMHLSSSLNSKQVAVSMMTEDEEEEDNYRDDNGHDANRLLSPQTIRSSSDDIL